MPALTMAMIGETLTTLTATSTNAVQTMIDDVSGFVAQIAKTRSSFIHKINVVGCFITCETNDVKYAFGVNPVSSGLGHILVKASEGIFLSSHKQIIEFRFISAVAGAHGVLQITPSISIP